MVLRAMNLPHAFPPAKKNPDWKPKQIVDFYHIEFVNNTFPEIVPRPFLMLK